MMRQAGQRFIVMIIPHRGGAITMADLALEQSQRPEIRTLAQSIKDSQTAEIKQMQQWHQDWYE